MMRWTTHVLLCAAAALLVNAAAHAQTTVTVPPPPTAVPGAPAAAPAAYPPPGSGAHTLHFFSQSISSGASCFCNSCIGQFLKNALKPFKALLGGGIAGQPGPIAANAAAGGAGSTAAAIQADQAGATARRAAVRFLGTVDCHYYPEAEAALITALRTDRSECVRLEAAIALSRGCCCTKSTMEALRITVSGSEKDGNPSETSPRVRIAAFNALQNCCSRGDAEPPGPGSMQRPEPAVADDDAAEPKLELSDYYAAIQKRPMAELVRNAEATLAQVKAVSAAQQVPLTLAKESADGSLLGLWVRSAKNPADPSTPDPYQPTPALMPVEQTMIAAQPAARNVSNAAHGATQPPSIVVSPGHEVPPWLANVPQRPVEYSAARESPGSRLMLEGDLMRLPDPNQVESFQPPPVIPDSSLPDPRTRLY